VSGTFALNVRDLIGAPGQMRELDFSVAAPETYGEAVAKVSEGAPIEISGRLESVHEGILASGDIRCTAAAECVRCLDSIDIPIEADFQELFAYSDNDGYDSQVVDDTVDLEPVVRDLVVLQLPFQPMCSPDCPGLDPQTGEKRPEGWQGSDEKGIDPRWEALGQLLTDDNNPGSKGPKK
jgi:Predicted metal-binding, possibly nucleic acid-binding protein